MPDNYFYFRETILLLTQTRPEVIKPFPRLTQPSTKFIMLINVRMPTIVGILTLIIMINTSPGSLKAKEVFIFNRDGSFEHPQHMYQTRSFFWRYGKNIRICYEDYTFVDPNKA